MMQENNAPVLPLQGAGQMAHRHLLQFAMCAGIGVASGKLPKAQRGRLSCLTVKQEFTYGDLYGKTLQSIG